MDAAARTWFDTRTTAAADWPLSAVLAAKAGTRVAVVIPARDEEATIGPLVRQIRESVMAGPHPLVDELLVVDSDSSDATAHEAAAAGARVLATHDIWPHIPTVPGKGEAMWRGVAATDADLIVFLDADLLSFAPDYVPGLIGPMLADPSIQVVKAAYARPLGDHPEAGGRVTELVARPLLNLFWPQLSGVIQPLAGEYAVRRSLFESLPIPCGYGVEIAILLDTARNHGLDAIAQVDLGVRRHRHHGEPYLGRMAAEIMQVAASRLDPAPNPSGSTLVQFSHGDDGVQIDEHAVVALVRPPMVSLINGVTPAG